MKLYNQKQMTNYASRIAKFELNWVIVGGESGPGAKPVMQEWVKIFRISA
jgi:protein gp37